MYSSFAIFRPRLQTLPKNWGRAGRPPNENSECQTWEGGQKVKDFSGKLAAVCDVRESRIRPPTRIGFISADQLGGK
jgi:hypothetical protein